VLTAAPSNARLKHKMFRWLSSCDIPLTKVGRFGIPIPERGGLVERVRQLQDATKHGINPDHILQSLLMKAKSKDGQGYEYFLLVLPWSKKFDELKVTKAIGCPFAFAQKSSVEAVTGYRPGQVSPIPLSTTPVKVLIDRGVDRKNTQYYVPIGEEGLRIRLGISQIKYAINRTGLHKATFAQLTH